MAYEKKEKPPTDDPTLPSYQCQQYNDMAVWWEYWSDMWEGTKNWYVPLEGIVDPDKAEAYLPQEQAEPGHAYNARVARSPFHKYFKPAGQGFAGLLSDYVLDEDVPPTIETYEDNINLKGDSLKSFLCKCDEDSFRLGYCIIQVDRTRAVDEEGNTLLTDRAAEQELEGTIRNYLIRLDPRDLINWDTDIAGGRVLLTRAITIERRWESDPDGEYGKVEKCYYREFLPGEQILWEVRKATEGQQKWVAAEVQRITDLPEVIPLTVYPDEQETPLENLADLQLQHYRITSDYCTGMHRVNIATVVRTGVVQPGFEHEAPAVALGWNSYQDLPEGATFGFAEPSGNALAATRQAIMDLQQTMEDASLSFLGMEGENATATQALLDATQAKATIRGYAEQKESAVQRIFELWGMMANEQGEGGITINRNLLQPPLEVADIERLAKLNIISNATAIEMINRLGTAIDADEEAQRINEEAIRRLASGRRNAPPNVPPRANGTAPAPTNTVIPNGAQA